MMDLWDFSSFFPHHLFLCASFSLPTLSRKLCGCVYVYFYSLDFPLPSWKQREKWRGGGPTCIYVHLSIFSCTNTERGVSCEGKEMDYRWADERLLSLTPGGGWWLMMKGGLTKVEWNERCIPPYLILCVLKWFLWLPFFNVGLFSPF